jgi:glutamate N-acetyltransferase/amino-acid N-acetyltransferase
VDRTFNRLLTDGARSTNDTVICLASGEAGPCDLDALEAALAEACGALATMMAEDAEGATKVIHLVVEGAVSDAAAHAAARNVADSLLVKCSFNGEDPYWGRVVSELATAGTPFDLDRCSVAYGGVTVCAAGVAVPHDAAAVAAHLAERHVTLTCDLGLGTGSATMLTVDLGHGYIDENRTTS